MISISTAQQLKSAGLQWKPAQHDFFAVPFSELDEQLFVISDMSVLVEAMGSEQAITFTGTVEWAMDYLLIADAIWVPTEAQLRQALEKLLVERGEQQPVLTLHTTSDGYQCSIRFEGSIHSYEDFGASECYAAALLDLLNRIGSRE